MEYVPAQPAVRRSQRCTNASRSTKRKETRRHDACTRVPATHGRKSRTKKNSWTACPLLAARQTPTGTAGEYFSVPTMTRHGMRPPRGPITRTHLRAFCRSLHLNFPYGAAAWSNALAPYSGCRRLGEVTIRSPPSSPSCETHAGTRASRRRLRLDAAYSAFISSGRRPFSPLGESAF
jgi:hypothetical protein